jgi:CheY-like chemotaxis protein
MTRTILIVDDEGYIDTRFLTPEEGAGLRFLQARNGSEAVDTLVRQPVDLVVLDLFLPPGEYFQNISPRETGIQILKVIYQKLKLNLPTVIVSAASGADTQRKIWQNIPETEGGSIRVLEKPISLFQLIPMLREMVAV